MNTKSNLFFFVLIKVIRLNLFAESPWLILLCILNQLFEITFFYDLQELNELIFTAKPFLVKQNKCMKL